MKRSIVWFKTDLRLHDNETLVKAIEHSDEIIPVYCFDESHFKKNEFGFHTTGTFRSQFLVESLIDLDFCLRKLNSGLIILYGKPEVDLYKLAKQLNIQKVFAKKEVAYEEKKTEEIVERELWHLKCGLETFSTSTLYHAQDLPFAINDIPDIFTSFRRKTEMESQIRNVFEAPLKIKSPEIPELDLSKLSAFGSKETRTDSRAAILFKGGETEGYKRLNYYFNESKKVSTYKDTRNEMVGSDYSSKFSPWLALGCLSPREVYYELKKYEDQYGANESTYWLIFELLWRDYFRFMMKKHRHKFFLLAGIKNNNPKDLIHNQSKLNKWVNGQTGVDFIDANMNELRLTGYMSNRGRQNVASYFCNDLKLDWRFGAAYFEQQLIDYDVCSNWGNWAYLAGVGNDPKGKRYFNIDKQAQEYDKNLIYRKLWLS